MSYSKLKWMVFPGRLSFVCAFAVGAAFCSFAQADVIPIALNYNFNGVVHAGESGQPDNLNGFRAISDRALDFTGGVPFNQTLNQYTLISTPGTLDIVHLGNRDTVDGGNWQFDSSQDGDDIGVQPLWLSNVDQSGPQTTVLPETIILSENSYIGIIFQISNGGGLFDVRLSFTEGDDFVGTLNGPDWYGPGGGQPSFGSFAGRENVDTASLGASLLLTEGIIDLGGQAGRGLASITFENRSNTAAGYAILAVNVEGTECGEGNCAGACCFDDLSCQDVSNETECVTLGGYYEGGLTECATTICSVGACCIDGACSSMVEQACVDSGGVYLGDGLDCSSVSCNGACCTTDLGCSEVEGEAACDGLGGYYQGDAVSCFDIVCPVGACCIEGECSVVSSDACALAGGNYIGDANDCTPESCMGGCCVDGFCMDGYTEDTCEGFYLGDSTFCFDSPPCNDACFGAIPITDGSAFGDSCSSVAPDEVEASCQTNSNQDVWFLYTATCTGEVTIDTEGSDDPNMDDTVLSAYDVCGGDELACDDDGGTGALSRIQLEVTEGQAVYIRVAGFSSDCGLFFLNVQCEDSGACCNEDLSCSDNVTQTDCEAGGGEFSGVDTTCDSIVCGGACCLGEGGCIQALNESACQALGGAFQGDGVSCSQITCPSLGPCCLEQATICSDLIEEVCTDQGGVWFGPSGLNPVSGVTVVEVSSHQDPSLMAPDNIIDGSGLSTLGPIDQRTHSNGFPWGGGSNIFWHSCEHEGQSCGLGTDYGDPDLTPDDVFITLDLNGTYDIDHMLVWNFNAVWSGGDETDRGIQQYDLLVAPDGVDPTVPANFTPIVTDGLLLQAGGDAEPAQFVPLSVLQVRYVRIEADSNFGGTVTGLSEVRFMTVFEDCSTFECVMLPGDCDYSGSVDLMDYAALYECLAGPSVDPPNQSSSGCLCLDFDFDDSGTVDMNDYASFSPLMEE